MEIVPYPAHIAKMVAIQDGGGKVKLPIATQRTPSKEKSYNGGTMYVCMPHLLFMLLCKH